MSEAEPIQDQWARWLLHRRHGGDSEVQKAMLDDLFDERDLLTFAWDAGFRELRLELQITVTSAKPRRWDVFARQSGNPNIPTPEEATKEVLTPTEAEQLIRHLRSLVETGQGMQQAAEAYLWAVKDAG